eukprot:2803590-Prymnesium_polylepis.1
MCFDDAAAQLPAEARTARLLEVDGGALLAFSRCGFSSTAMRRTFHDGVLRHAMAGQYSYCGEERNPFVDAVLLEARHARVPEESLLNTRRNCTGQPANAFNKPKVDIGAEALAFGLVGGTDCGAPGPSSAADAIEQVIADALALAHLGPSSS